MSAQFQVIGEVVLKYLEAGLKDQFTEVGLPLKGPGYI